MIIGYRIAFYKKLNNLILTHPIDILQPHPNLEPRDGIGILVNQFWTTWNTPRTYPCYNGPSPSP